MATPSTSSRSAVPHIDDAARLPCLHTRPPAPTIAKAASVDTLMLPDPSPPVPTMSTTPSGSSSTTGVERSSMAPTIPASSSAVSPFIRSATM
jgi:hypothetical protein